MKHHVLLLLACVITLASATCFRPSMKCSPCGNATFCADGLMCLGGLCLDKPTDKCATDAAMDSGSSSEVVSDVPAPDSDNNASDVPDSSAEVGVNQCVDRCCIGAACFNFPARLRQGLLLWADRTSLGEPGLDLETWYDRSEHGHHIKSLTAGAPPRVQLDPVGPIAEITDMRTSLATASGPSLRLGTEDFSVLVLTRCN
ncbi:MAG TPA: hypothetical protein VFH73_28030, partial [Polyangia bacterium]|nr:hypothetical protein [Polyangia bacterium]